MTPRHAAPEPKGTGTRLVAVGAVLFVLGVVAVVVAVVPVLLGAAAGPDLPSQAAGVLLPLGFGLALGVLVDAFVVRMTLVPAVLALLGNRAWWIPRWLDRVTPNVDIEGEHLRGAPAPARPTER